MLGPEKRCGKAMESGLEGDGSRSGTTAVGDATTEESRPFWEAETWV